MDWLVIETLDTVATPEEEIRLEDRCVNDRVLLTVTVIHPETVSDVMINLEEKAEGFTIVVVTAVFIVVVSITTSVELPSVTVFVLITVDWSRVTVSVLTPPWSVEGSTNTVRVESSVTVSVATTLQTVVYLVSDVAGVDEQSVVLVEV